MRILVTGGYGFIGLALVESLLKENHEITIIDDLSSQNSSNNIADISHFNISADSKNCETIFKDNNFDIVVHLAHKKITKDNLEDYNNILQANNKGLINILYLSEKYKVDKFITISHYNVYGQQDIFPITENHELKPIDEQGYDGVIRELYCDQYRRKGLNVVILRVGEVYGPRINNPNSFIRKLLTVTNIDNDLEIDNSILDYIYIGDVVEAIKIVCENYSPNILNISSKQGTTQKEILELFSIFSHKYENITTKQNSNLDHKYVLDNKRAKSKLKWYPKYDLSKGIEKTIRWYENNENTPNQVSIVDDSIKKNKMILPKVDKNLKYIENILLFLVFATFNYIIRYKLNIKIDLFILYIVLINLIYGFKQGSLAVILSIITNIWFKFTFEDMKTINLINDSSNILYSTMYFIIGITIGNKVDNIKIEKEILIQDLDNIKADMDFTYEVYEKSIEIKNILQNTIENYDDSFQKTLGIIEKLEKSDSNSIFDISQELLIKTLKIDDVYIYAITQDRKKIRLVVSPKNTTFKDRYIIDESKFLKINIIDQQIFINKTLEKTLPTISAPLFKGKKVVAVIFIDKIEFQSLNYQLLNTLKVLIYLISNRLSGIKEYIRIVSNKEKIENK